jgi:hypothetical protein
MRTTLGFACLVVVLGCGDNHDKPDAGGIPDAPPPDACVPTSIHATVTSGDMTIDNTQREVFLDMEPPLERSVLFFSAREIEPQPRFGAIRCELVPEDTTAMTPAGLSCRHPEVGTDSNPITPITIHWQVVTFDTGVKVIRGLADTNTTNPQTITLPMSVDPAKSFVVLGGSFAGGGGWGSNEFSVAELKNGTTLEVRQNAPGAFVPYQVIEMQGATVTRGTSSLAITDTMKNVPIAGGSAGGFALVTHSNDNPSGVIAAAMMLQATLSADGTSLALKRTMGGTAMEVAYQIVHIPFVTQQFTTDFAAGEGMKSQAVANLGATTSAAFSTMQAVVGHSTGSTAYADAVTLDLVGESSFTLTPAAGSVSVQRASTTAAASVTWNAIDFAKDPCN